MVSSRKRPRTDAGTQEEMLPRSTLCNAPLKLTLSEFMVMMNGPKVDIFVGQERKHYQLPKELLCYHSEYFSSCFNGNFKEGDEGKLELIDVEVEIFDRIINYVCRGEPIFVKTETSTKGLEDCVAITMLADRLWLPCIYDCIAEPLESFVEYLVTYNPNGTPDEITPTNVELFFRIFPQGHSVRTALARAVMRDGLPGRNNGPRFTQALKDIDGLAIEVLAKLNEAILTVKFYDRETNNTITLK